jgi:hypothetical protein
MTTMTVVAAAAAAAEATSNNEKGLVLFRVQTESTGNVAAVVIARIKREPEGLRTGKEL